MDFSWTQALELLGPDATFRVTNMARPPQSYLFAQFLPERPSTSYHVEDGSLIVRATMAGLVGMDSPYPPGGIIDATTFLKESAKIGTALDLTEKTLRTIQEMVMRLRLAGGNVPEFLAREILNITDKLLTQPMLDRTEWLRGQALAKGLIDWTFNGKDLEVDYGVPSANKLTPRTGNDAYGGTTSKFWTDVRAAQRILRYNVRAAVAHPDMIDAIINNDVNKVNVLAQSNSAVTIQKYRGDLERASTDARDTLTLISYGLEGEVPDLANSGKTINVPFQPRENIEFLGENAGTQYVVGAGSDAPIDYPLGYTHNAPTVEGAGRPGRWSRVFTPEARPWALRGEGASNVLPVLTSPEKIVILESELPA